MKLLKSAALALWYTVAVMALLAITAALLLVALVNPDPFAPPE